MIALMAFQSALQIFVLSGPNGAGKSTTATVLLPKILGVEQFVNSGLITQGLSPFAPEKSAPNRLKPRLPASKVFLAIDHVAAVQGI